MMRPVSSAAGHEPPHDAWPATAPRERCGTVTLCGDLLERLGPRVLEATGFVLAGHEPTLHGLCGDRAGS